MKKLTTVSAIEEFMNVVSTSIMLSVGLIILEQINRELLRVTDFQKYVEDYLIPEEVYKLNKYLKHYPTVIIAP